MGDDLRSGRPISVLTDENVERVRQVIEDGPHSTYDDIIVETDLSRGTIERIIHWSLKMRKVTSRWVAHQLTDEQKQKQLRICRHNLEKFRSGTWRLCDVITVMRHGFFTGRLVVSQATLTGLAKMNHQERSFVEIDPNLRRCFVSSSNLLLLFLYTK